MHDRAPNVWLDLLIKVRIRCDSVERLLDFVQKPCAEARLLFFVGLKSVENVGFCLRRDDERSAHSDKIRRLTSAQGEPAFGLARQAAKRLRRSSRVSSERSICSGHSAMLSQISATSRMRSETGSSKVSAAENFMRFKLAQRRRFGQEQNAAKRPNWRSG
jgi:hypothetical protein